MEGMRTHLPIGRCRRSDEIHIVLVLIIKQYKALPFITLQSHGIEGSA